MIPKVMVLCTMVALGSVSAAQAQQPVDSTAARYARTCAACHGPKGTPNPAIARASRDFSDSLAMASVADSVLRQTISEGKGRTMPAYKARLTPDQINALISYVRSLSRH